MNSIIQPSIRHLIVERRLKDEKEIYFLAHRFPNVKYLQLLLHLINLYLFIVLKLCLAMMIKMIHVVFGLN